MPRNRETPGGANDANEISEAADVPLSTTYRELDLLVEASLLEERTEIRPDGHAIRYALDFDAVQIAIDEDGGLEVGISRPARTPDERLERLWSEVRRETRATSPRWWWRSRPPPSSSAG